MGQATYIQRIAEPQDLRDEYGIERYVRQSRRPVEILDNQLARKAYLLSDEHSFVDTRMRPKIRALAV